MKSRILHGGSPPDWINRTRWNESKADEDSAEDVASGWREACGSDTAEQSTGPMHTGA